MSESSQNISPTETDAETDPSSFFAGYYSPEQIAADALTYNQCMQSAENSQIPSTTVLHQGTQLGHPSNLSPVNQVSYLVTRLVT